MKPVDILRKILPNFKVNVSSGAKNNKSMSLITLYNTAIRGKRVP